MAYGYDPMQFAQQRSQIAGSAIQGIAQGLQGVALGVTEIATLNKKAKELDAQWQNIYNQAVEQATPYLGREKASIMALKYFPKRLPNEEAGEAAKRLLQAGTAWDDKLEVLKKGMETQAAQGEAEKALKGYKPGVLPEGTQGPMNQGVAGRQPTMTGPVTVNPYPMSQPPQESYTPPETQREAMSYPGLSLAGSKELSADPRYQMLPKDKPQVDILEQLKIEGQDLENKIKQMNLSELNRKARTAGLGGGDTANKTTEFLSSTRQDAQNYLDKVTKTIANLKRAKTLVGKENMAEELHSLLEGTNVAPTADEIDNAIIAATLELPKAQGALRVSEKALAEHIKTSAGDYATALRTGKQAVQQEDAQLRQDAMNTIQKQIIPSLQKQYVPLNLQSIVDALPENYRDAIKADIQDMLSRGITEQQILQAFQSQGIYK